MTLAMLIAILVMAGCAVYLTMASAYWTYILIRKYQKSIDEFHDIH